MGNIIYPIWAECPMLTRMVIVGYPAMSLVLMMLASTSASMSWLVDSLFTCSINNLMQLKLWTLFWGPFYAPLSSGMAFVMILFEIYMAMNYFPAHEKEMGSSTFLCWMFLINALTSLVFLATMFCCGLYYHGTAMQAYYHFNGLRGLWPMVMVCLTLSSLSNPDGSTNFWGMVKIPNRWYPLALTGIFMLLNGRVMWNFVAALAVGYAYTKLRLERLLPSKPRVDRLEQKCCRGGRLQLLGAAWVPASSTSSFDVDVQVDRRYRNFTDFGNNTDSAAAASSTGGGAGGQFVAFGGSGNRLGEAVTAGTEMEVRETPEPAGQP